MSYNTRRTGTGAGRPGQTQVNYHQQPPRPAANVQSRNPGYTTTQQAGYNTAAQPAYTTQPTYSAPPLPKGPPQQPASGQPPLPPAQPAAQPPAQPPPAVPATPPAVVKKEPVTPAVTPADTPKMETSENGDTTQSKPPFWKKKPFVKVSNKIRKARQNAKLRRILNPKNALTFLNELRPGGIKFVVREEPGWGYVASVDVDGKAYTGHALSMSKAKVMASEQALKHVLLEQLSKAQTTPAAEKSDEKESTQAAEDEDVEMEEKEEGSEDTKAKKTKTFPEDELPWGSLAAFALHKLFAEWQKEGTDPSQGGQDKQYEEEVSEEPYFQRRPGPPEFGYGRRFPGPAFARGGGRGFAPYPPRGHPPGFVVPRRPVPAATFLANARTANAAANSMLPMKKIPDDANKRHPVMILNQLKPNVAYNESREGVPPHVVFIISLELEGKEYTGRGKSKKEAKKNAAKAALATMGIVYSNDD